MSSFSDSVANGLALASEFAGETITYTRGATVLTITGAIQGHTDWEADTPQPGLKVGERSADWLINFENIVGAVINLTPEKGDEIQTEDGRRFRCLPFGPQSLLYRRVNRSGGKWLRIHTKER